MPAILKHSPPPLLCWLILNLEVSMWWFFGGYQLHKSILLFWVAQFMPLISFQRSYMVPQQKNYIALTKQRIKPTEHAVFWMVLVSYVIPGPNQWEVSVTLGFFRFRSRPRKMPFFRTPRIWILVTRNGRIDKKIFQNCNCWIPFWIF